MRKLPCLFWTPKRYWVRSSPGIGVPHGFLEAFGCIWSSKEVFKAINGRAAHQSDLTGATP
uniref:Uncharacterized protein n=1 Tax=Brassica oleracea var. oleracea TaxID=109376 RepID=A0A0D3CXK6_BRAOL